jgi:3-hydroxybutyryl-CoA dehydrogenase
MFDLLTSIRKKPAIVMKEVPGFIGNRLQASMMREALSLVEKCVATPKDVDTVIMNGLGRRFPATGIFEIFDLAGARASPEPYISSQTIIMVYPLETQWLM